MRKTLGLVAATAAATAAAATVAITSDGSSHREAPLISQDPTGDDTDVYAFTAPDAPGALTVVANWLPFEDPGGGPNFYNFDPKARYYVNVDNTGDGRADVRFRFKFRTIQPNTAGAGYVVALPPVTDINDPGLQRQRMTVVRETLNVKGERKSARTIGRDLPVAPSNIGGKTMPDYEALAAQAISPLRGGGRIFAGQRDDPFFIPLDRVFDSVNLEGAGFGNEGGGIDTLAGYGVQSVILQVPEAQVTRNSEAVSAADAQNAVVGVWASTERRTVKVLRGAGDDRVERPWVQISRLGNPLINELVIPLSLKDKFNRTKPHRDLQNFGQYVLKPFPAAALNALFGLGIKETDRTDIVQALLTGIPGFTQIGPNPVPADTLKLNLGVPPSADENRFGVIGGDAAGFPNGRRLADDVVDITLRVVGGYLVPEDQGGMKLPLGDGVDANDQPFSDVFPYVPSLKNEIGGSPTEDFQTLRTPRPRRRTRAAEMSTARMIIVAGATAFAVALVALLATGRDEAPSRASQPVTADEHVAQATKYLQQVRETGDPKLYQRAEAELRRALELDPENATAYLERGSLRLSRHQFRAALADGMRARRLAPEAVTPFGVLVDARVELGRYRAAARTVQRMVDRRPDLSSYSRVSYLRELHGDVPGALAAMRRAATAAGNGENAAFALSTVGQLHFANGDYAQAARSQREALRHFAGYAPALGGLAQAQAALGDLDAARSLWKRALARQAAPDFALHLAEAELAAGNERAGRRALRQASRLVTGGPRINHERALFEAEHGDGDRAIELAREVWSAAPSAESASIMSWALTQAGRPQAGLRWVPEALELGTRDPRVLYRAGMTARAAGRPALAGQLLERALDASPQFSPLYAPRARAALGDL